MNDHDRIARAAADLADATSTQVIRRALGTDAMALQVSFTEPKTVRSGDTIAFTARDVPPVDEPDSGWDELTGDLPAIESTLAAPAYAGLLADQGGPYQDCEHRKARMRVTPAWVFVFPCPRPGCRKGRRRVGKPFLAYEQVAPGIPDRHWRVYLPNGGSTALPLTFDLELAYDYALQFVR